MCPACGNHNYAKRNACNKCQSLKPGMTMGGLTMGGLAGGYGGERRVFMPTRMGAPPTAGGATGNFAKFGTYHYASQEIRNRGHSPMMASSNMYGAYRGAAGMVGRYSPYA